jgi:hypothetical protein
MARKYTANRRVTPENSDPGKSLFKISFPGPPVQPGSGPRDKNNVT